jgi:hypothetical protein
MYMQVGKQPKPRFCQHWVMTAAGQGHARTAQQQYTRKGTFNPLDGQCGGEQNITGLTLTHHRGDKYGWIMFQWAGTMIPVHSGLGLRSAWLLSEIGTQPGRDLFWPESGHGMGAMHLRTRGHGITQCINSLWHLLVLVYAGWLS